jgi:hypothetical protein
VYVNGMAIHTLASDQPVWDETLSAPAEAGLHSIPSQTTTAERELLYWFFSRIWEGRGHVCEVGPWLGGTTRAIAEGMLANPQREPGARFYSFDKFENYSKAEVLESIGAPLVERGLMDRAGLERCAATRDFLELFRTLHQGRRYMEELLQVERRVLPHGPGVDLGAERELLLSEWAARFPVVFVDGCKSWYSTRFFMTQVVAMAEVGDWLFFQDHLWRTCYWLPCFTWLFRDALEPCFQAGTTLVLRWTRKVEPAEVMERMPEVLTAGDVVWLLRLFAEYGRAALEMGNEELVFALKLQQAAALIAVGERSLANFGLMSAARESYGFDSSRRLLESLEKPTYDEEGTPLVLNDRETARRLFEVATAGVEGYAERMDKAKQVARQVKVEGQLAVAKGKLEQLKIKMDEWKQGEQRRKNRRFGRILKRLFGGDASGAGKGGKA